MESNLKTVFEKELEELINKHSMEQYSDTADFILAQYLVSCLKAYNVAVRKREDWYGRAAIEVTNIID
jgi:hypothetical protein